MKSFIFRKKLVLRKDGKEAMGFFNPDTLETKIYAVGNTVGVEVPLKPCVLVCAKERKNGFIPFHTHPKKHNKNSILSSMDLIGPYLTGGSAIMFNQKYLCLYVPLKRMTFENAKKKHDSIRLECNSLKTFDFEKYCRLAAHIFPVLCRTYAYARQKKGGFMVRFLEENILGEPPKWWKT